MIGIDELFDWTKAEPEEVDNLKALERAAVAYIHDLGGRYFGALAEVSELHVWRGGVLCLNSEPVDADYFTLEEWSGSGWDVIAEDDFFRDGRLIFLPTRSYSHAAVHFRATYDAGYTASATDTDIWAAPEDIKQAVRMLVMDWYMNPQGVTVGTIRADVAAAVEAILRKYS